MQDRTRGDRGVDPSVGAAVKIAFIGDLHIGNHRSYGGPLVAGLNDRCRAVLGALERALVWANSQGCTDAVVLGDVFDTPKPLPQQLAATRRALGTFSGAVHLLLGNHDRVSAELGDHALGPLHEVAEQAGLEANVFVYDTPTVIGDSTVSMLLCPFDARPVLEWLPAELENHGRHMRGRARVVCGHFGLWDRAQAGAQPWLAGSADAVEAQAVATVLGAADVSRLYVGNYHTPHRWQIGEVVLEQLGALVPTGFDNAGHEYGQVVTWPEGDRVLVPGPRFVVVSGLASLQVAADRARDERCTLYAEWRCAPDSYEDVTAACAAFGQVEGLHVDVRIDRQHAREQAQRAAGAARRSETLVEAVHEYVAKCGLLAQVSREDVLSEVKRFLNC
jgi:hypothetical protein